LIDPHVFFFFFFLGPSSCIPAALSGKRKGAFVAITFIRSARFPNPRFCAKLSPSMAWRLCRAGIMPRVFIPRLWSFCRIFFRYRLNNKREPPLRSFCSDFCHTYGFPFLTSSALVRASLWAFRNPHDVLFFFLILVPTGYAGLNNVLRAPERRFRRGPTSIHFFFLPSSFLATGTPPSEFCLP